MNGKSFGPRGLVGLAALLLLATAGCSDDSGGTADRGVDGAPADQGLADRGGDAGHEQGTRPDTTPSGCSAAEVGKSCTRGGNECAGSHVCLVPSGATRGWCTCSCTVDSPSTTYDEDTCPGSALLCASYDAGGGAGAKPYCFKMVGGNRSKPLSWWSPTDATTPWMIATKNTPASYPFNILGLAYVLIGSTKYCDTALAHRVDLVLSSAATPEASPTVKQSFAITAASASESVRRVDRFLGAPASLGSGQHGYLLLEMAVNSSKNVKICVMSAGTNSVYQSKVTKTPYSWESQTGSAQLMLLGF
jgi:hypothetical protein